MTRELSLVLLGSGILSAGYFLFQDNEDLAAKEEDQMRQQVGTSNGHRYGGTMFIYYHGGYSSARTSPALGGSVASRGFGGIGRVSSGG
jgi:hypothetical protein